MRYVRNSTLRTRGSARNTINLRSRLRTSEINLVGERRVTENLLGTIGDVRAAVAAVRSPNGTTVKIGRILSQGI